jgi:hypothetical protein
MLQFGWCSRIRIKGYYCYYWRCVVDDKHLTIIIDEHSHSKEEWIDNHGPTQSNSAITNTEYIAGGVAHLLHGSAKPNGDVPQL